IMKIQCDLCKEVEADVLCCADEAVLCRGCDEKVHAANKLSQKHERISLLKHPSVPSSSFPSQLPLCDICQIMTSVCTCLVGLSSISGYFFCLEDMAILCKHCDSSTHMASPHSSSHQRFFIGGVKGGLQSTTNDSCIPCSIENYKSWKSPNISLSAGKERGVAMTLDIESTSAETTVTSAAIHLPSYPHWPLDDFSDADYFNRYEYST
ncbi:hypothetical protein CFOL_v3_15085, partial [Cephalotus follicularis]